jgi:hypothetical protein
MTSVGRMQKMSRLISLDEKMENYRLHSPPARFSPIIPFALMFDANKHVILYLDLSQNQLRGDIVSILRGGGAMRPYLFPIQERPANKCHARNSMVLPWRAPGWPPLLLPVVPSKCRVGWWRKYILLEWHWWYLTGKERQWSWCKQITGDLT